MKRRININIDADNLTDAEAVSLVLQVIQKGRISNSKHWKQYCWMSTSDSANISASKRSDLSDTFHVWKP